MASNEWLPLYQSALQECRPTSVFGSLHKATKAMVRRLHETEDMAERNAILTGLGDLRVLRISWIRANQMFT
jgi:hypothetical protein